MPLLILFWPIAEIYLLIQLAGRVGFVNTFFYCLFSAVVGWAVIQFQGRATWVNVMMALQRGQVPSDSLMNGLLGVVGGLLLIIPGILSDILGFLFIFPLTRPLVRLWFKTKVLGRMSGRVFYSQQTTQETQWEPSGMRDVIDVEKVPLPPGESSEKED